MQLNRFTKEHFFVCEDDVYRHMPLSMLSVNGYSSYVFSNASRKHCEKFGDEMIVRIKTEEEIEQRIQTSIFFQQLTGKTHKTTDCASCWE